MNVKQIFFDYNLDHIVVALPVQAITAGSLLAMHTPLMPALLAGAAVASWGFYCREFAEYEYYLEQKIGYDPHKFWVWEFWAAHNPFVWPQKGDFFAPTLAVLAVCLLAL